MIDKEMIKMIEGRVVYDKETHDFIAKIIEENVRDYFLSNGYLPSVANSIYVQKCGECDSLHLLYLPGSVTYVMEEWFKKQYIPTEKEHLSLMEETTVVGELRYDKDFVGFYSLEQTEYSLWNDVEEKMIEHVLAKETPHNYDSEEEYRVNIETECVLENKLFFPNDNMMSAYAIQEYAYFFEKQQKMDTGENRNA